MASKKPRRIWSVLAGMLNTVSYVVLIIGLSLIISTFAILVANDVLALVKDGGELTVELKQESTPKAVGNLLMEMEAIMRQALLWKNHLYVRKMGSIMS